MALHLFQRSGGALRLFTAYEDGSVALREYTRGCGPSVEGEGWAVRLHGESGACAVLICVIFGGRWHTRTTARVMMAMRAARASVFALTV